MRELRELVAAPDEAAVQRTWRAIRERRESPPPARWRPVAVGLALAALIAIAAWPRHHASVLAIEGGGEMRGVFEATTEPRALALTDGTQLVLGAHTRIAVAENTTERVHVVLEHGRAELEARARRWTVDCGVATVETTDTRFVVERDAEKVTVRVSEGRARVASERLVPPVIFLAAGQQTTIPITRTAEVELAPVPSPTPAPTLTPDVVEPSRKPQTPPRPVRSDGPAAPVDAGRPGADAPAWRELAAQGDYAAAYKTFGADGFARETASMSTVADLVSLADVARLAGDPRAAVAPLRRAAALGAPGSAVAGYSLGRLLLDQLADPAGAAIAIEAAIARGIPASLDEPARARLVEAHARAGHADAARAAAAAYERRQPSGPSLLQVRQWARGAR